MQAENIHSYSTLKKANTHINNMDNKTITTIAVAVIPQQDTTT